MAGSKSYHQKCFIFIGLAIFISTLNMFNQLYFLTTSCDTPTIKKVRDPVRDLTEALSKDRLSSIAKKYREDYKKAKPYPHITIDGLFPDSILEALTSEIPEETDDNGCVKGASRCYTMKGNKPGDQLKKSSIRDEEKMGYYTRVTYSILRSQLFIKFLQDLSGIDGLIPELIPGGASVIAEGGLLNIHADFNYNKQFKLNRRVNMFIFLNPDWKDSYGGHLELWSRDMKTCHQKILPVLGRFVVFTTDDFSYHGHPQPLTPPKGRSRRSLAFYFYTNGRPLDECINRQCDKRHLTLFQVPNGCEMCGDDACKAYPEIPFIPDVSLGLMKS